MLTSDRATNVVRQSGSGVSGRTYAVNLTTLVRILRQRELDSALRCCFVSSSKSIGFYSRKHW